MSAAQGKQVIESRKRADNAYKEMDAVMAQTKKILQIANFENQTQAKIERLSHTKEVQRHKAQQEAALNVRRQQLADLYNYEIEMWRAEAMARVETQEDRKARIMERAYQLRDARESERNSLVQKKYDAQWRDACDDARTLDSKAMTIFMNNERLRQIEEKKQRNQNLSSQEDAFVEEWTRQMDAVAAQDAAKQEYRKRIDAETSAAVKAQIEDNMRLKEEFRQKKLGEELSELDRLRGEIEADEADQRAKQEAAFARGRAVLEFNDQYRRVREEEASVEKEQDAILLDYALRKEREAEAAEEAKRNAAKDGAVRFRRYLEEQMVKEAEDTAFVDEIRKREEERVWKARDDALQAREDARAHLMKMVDEGRQEQIRYKQEASMVDGVEGKKFAEKFLRESQDAILKEQAEVEARRDKARQTQHLLQEQIDYRKYKEDMAKQEEYLELKQMKYMERQHQQRLAEQAGSVRGHRPLMKNNWYS
mmetsp:Transcript_15101/g.25173  ORF Transcript_15101/g.25173 Transcript_15101/m.25173 type:complete len:481 (-) Transcript_15101:324-1766(-)